MKIVVVGGVTAAGKTDAALAIARALGGELIGADSVQVYRGFDIGSAKPTQGELGPIRHHLIDVIDAPEELDAARYAALADEAIAGAHARGRLPIVVGGTGLWIRALMRGLVELPPVDPVVRANVEAEADRVGLEVLHARLRAIDPFAAARIHPNDRLRIVRALEVEAQTGQPIGEHWQAHARGAPRYDALFYVLDRPREELYPALHTRIAAMLERGWVDEVRALLERFGPEVRPIQSVGYAQIVEHLQQDVPIEETAQRIYKATRIYTRRQRTWFRGEPGAKTWTSAGALVEPAALAAIEAFSKGVQLGDESTT